MAPAITFHLRPRPAFRPPGTITRTVAVVTDQGDLPWIHSDGSGFRTGPAVPTVVLFGPLGSLSRYAPDPEPADCPTGTTASEWGVDPAGMSPAVRPPTASCFRLPGTIPHISCLVVTRGVTHSCPLQALRWSGPGLPPGPLQRGPVPARGGPYSPIIHPRERILSSQHPDRERR